MKILCFLGAIALVALADETPALRELRTGNLRFTGKTYKELAKENEGKNFLVCPLSVEVVLALTEAGAGGNTAQQLIKGLNLPDTEEKIHEVFKTIAPTLNVNDKYTLSSANKIYVKDQFKTKQTFKDVATGVFNSEIGEVNFAENEAAAAEINKWVLTQTHDKIKDLINQDDLDQNTRIVLINALYFQGSWLHPFYTEKTSEKSFKLNKAKETKVKMMEQTKHFDYHEDSKLNAKFLKMRYYGSPIEMILVLPNDVEGLAALELNIEKVLETTEFGFEEVHVQIPHVHVESKIDFIPILKKFGVEDAFQRHANFSRLSDHDKVFISKVIQKTFIDIEEKGTTAAAATAVIGMVGSSWGGRDPPPPKEFEANHPFIFIVTSPNGVLFAGRYVNPNA